MKKHIIILGVCVLLLTSVFVFAGCSDKKTPANDDVSISLNHVSINMQEGGQALLVATVSNFYGDVVFVSSDKSVADVDIRGVVTGISEGSAVITATIGEKSATCTVTVTAGEEGEPALEILPILTLLSKPATVSVGYEFDLSAELVLSGNALSGVQFHFYVTDESVAEIIGNTFKAKSVGRTDLVVSCEYNGRAYSDRYNIQIV